MTLCESCKKNIWEVDGCIYDEIKIDGEWYKRILSDAFECHDCGAEEGKPHHLGCDMEKCPVCYGQMIWCNCGGRKEALRNGENIFSLIRVEKEFIILFFSYF